MSAKWTCGDVLCASYVGKQQNSRSYNTGKCMFMRKRCKYKRTFINKRSGKNNCIVELN